MPSCTARCRQASCSALCHGTLAVYDLRHVSVTPRPVQLHMAQENHPEALAGMFSSTATDAGSTNSTTSAASSVGFSVPSSAFTTGASPSLLSATVEVSSSFWAPFFADFLLKSLKPLNMPIAEGDVRVLGVR